MNAAVTSQYAATAERTLALISRKGGPVVFKADTWTGGTLTSDVIGQAIQVPDNPAKFAALGLVIANPVTLLIAAKDLGIDPRAGMRIRWAARDYTVKSAEAIAPDGTTEGTILWTVIGDGGA